MFFQLEHQLQAQCRHQPSLPKCCYHPLFCAAGSKSNLLCAWFSSSPLGRSLATRCFLISSSWIYSGKPANGSVPLVSTKLWTAITLFVEQIYSLKEAERKYTFSTTVDVKLDLPFDFIRGPWLYWLQFCSLHVTAKTMQCKWFSSFLLSAL